MALSRHDAEQEARRLRQEIAGLRQDTLTLERRQDRLLNVAKLLRTEYEALERDRDAISAFDKRWPNACDACGGWGGSVYYDNHGIPGPGESMFEPCGTCIDAGVCPRCRGLWPGLEDDETNCPHCAWSFDTPEGRPEIDGMGIVYAVEQLELLEREIIGEEEVVA